MRGVITILLSSVLAATILAQSPASRPARQAPRSAPAPLSTAEPIETIAITNGRVFPVSGAPIDKATVVMPGTKIVAVGGTVAVPPGARVIDAAGKIVTPGFLESATQIGVVEIPLGADGTNDQASTDKELSAAFNVVDSFNGDSMVIPITRVEGITRAVVTPAGTGHVILGRGARFDCSGR